MNLSDRIAQFKAEVTSTPEGKKKGIKLAIGVGCLVLAVVVGAAQMMVSSSASAKEEKINPQAVAQIEALAEELEQATAEETEEYQERVAAGEAEAPEPPQPVVRSHPKGVGYIPGSASDPANQPPAPAPEPEPEPDDPG